MVNLQYTKSNYGKIVLAGLIDAALVIAFFAFFVSSYEIPPLIIAYPNLAIFIFFVLYRITTILIASATLGMSVLGLTFLNNNEESIGLVEKLLATIFILYQGVGYYRKV